MKDKENIVVFIDWYRPAHKAGGPIKSLENMVTSLFKEIHFYIVTSFYDVDNTALKVQPNTWIKEENHTIIYLDTEHQNREFVLQALKDISFGTVYFNSMFSPNFSVKPLSYLSSMNKKMVLAPRGMLGKGALRLKRFKKMAFLAFAKTSKRYKKLNWHASSKLEEQEIKLHFGKKAEVIVALNLFDVPISKPVLVNKKPKELKLFFFSRIAKKKNLHFALRCLKELDHLKGISLKIIGPIEETSYWESCKEYFTQFQNIEVSQCEVLNTTELAEEVKDAHFFFFPTLHENFGHVIAESLALAKPIIISDQTPWDNLEGEKVGYSISLEEKNTFIETLKRCYEMDEEEFRQMQDNCLPYLKSFKEKYSSISQYLTLLQN